ncbi:hypothetical protein [Actinomadura pelletieri]|uniref:hypothetical protein n=1 Tax=Actinomadura pelletieri TaxID=111805 RepID=UPI0011C3DC06|nr:hypothetical protein [Actinomadura pelletieri]
MPIVLHGTALRTPGGAPFPSTISRRPFAPSATVRGHASPGALRTPERAVGTTPPDMIAAARHAERPLGAPTPPHPL